VNKSVDSVDRCRTCIFNHYLAEKEDYTIDYCMSPCHICLEEGGDMYVSEKEYKRFEKSQTVVVLEISGTFPSLNQYIAAMNRNRHSGNKMKQDETDRVQWLATQVKQKFTKVHLTFRWYEKNRKRDLDNVAFAKKFILDGLVKASVIPNDGWKNVVGFEDKFYVDKDNPRVVVEILEVE